MNIYLFMHKSDVYINMYMYIYIFVTYIYKYIYTYMCLYICQIEHISYSIFLRV